MHLHHRPCWNMTSHLWPRALQNADHQHNYRWPPGPYWYPAETLWHHPAAFCPCGKTPVPARTHQLRTAPRLSCTSLWWTPCFLWVTLQRLREPNCSCRSSSSRRRAQRAHSYFLLLAPEPKGLNKNLLNYCDECKA